MIPTEPQVSDSGKYTITQTAEALEVSTKTISRHITKGLINPIIGKRTKTKLFTGKEIKRYHKNYY